MGKQSPNPIATSGSFLAASPDSVLSPLERDPRSPKGWRKRASDGVGLGIVVALERSSSSASNVPVKIVANSQLPFHHQRPTSPLTPPLPARPRQHHKQQRWSLWDDYEEEEVGTATFFYGSPPPRIGYESGRFAVPGFLKYCNLCRKKLDGKDIYMYRGEKGFCSSECRCMQIAADEHPEQRSYVTSRATSETATSVGDTDRRLFYTGIMASS